MTTRQGEEASSLLTDVDSEANAEAAANQISFVKDVFSISPHFAC